MIEKEAKEAWRDILTGGANVMPTEAVYDELSLYSGLSIDAVKSIAANSNSITAQKWAESNGPTPEKLKQFYDSVSNWVFGTLTYHAKQAEGEYSPLPVIVADELHTTQPGQFLDFGSGVGTASLLFDRIGWSVTAADISKPLMEFSKWRFKRHAADIPIVDLNTESLPEDYFDVIAGFNTMAHIVDVESTIKMLRSALKSGGLLIFDIDTRSKEQQMWWHVMETHYPYLRIMRCTGFELEKVRAGIYFYKRVERSPAAALYWRLRDGIRYSSLMAHIRSIIKKLRHYIARHVT